MADAVFAAERCGRFSHVVAERRPANGEVGRSVLHDERGVLEDVIYMVFRILLAVLHGGDFGKDEREHVEHVEEGVMNVLAEDESVKLRADALCRDAIEQVLMRAHGQACVGVDLEAELRTESASSQDAQSVFGEPPP